MNRFVTLMKREWLQHRIGWLVLMVLPSAIMMGLSLIDAKGLQVQVAGDGTNLPPLALLPIPLQTVGWMAAMDRRLTSIRCAGCSISSFMRSSRLVPPAMNFAPLVRAAAFAAAWALTARS